MNCLKFWKFLIFHALISTLNTFDKNATVCENDKTNFVLKSQCDIIHTSLMLLIKTLTNKQHIGGNLINTNKALSFTNLIRNNIQILNRLIYSNTKQSSSPIHIYLQQSSI